MVQKKIESLRESLRKNFNEIQTAIRTNKPFEVKVKMNRLAALMTVANTMTADLKKLMQLMMVGMPFAILIILLLMLSVGLRLALFPQL